MPKQDVVDPVSPVALLQATPPGTHAVVLDGGGSSSWQNGRAIYADSPSATLAVYGSGWARWQEAGRTRWRWGPPLEQWQRFIDRACAASPDDEAGGILTVIAYDLKHWVERLPRRQPWPATPVLFSAAYDWSYVLDRRQGAAWVSAPSAADAARRAERCGRLIDQKPPLRPWVGTDLLPLMSADRYRRMVERALAYISAGDVYQVNLAQPFRARGRVSPVGLFAVMQERYPMPFSAYVDGGAWALVSSSPECFLTIDGAQVSTYPIKGTRRQGTEGSPPDALAGAGSGPPVPFVEDPKERAEHVMIVDLERNDLGRVCEAGSIEVRNMFEVRSFPLLHHMISEVRGQLRHGVSLAELLRAVFPGGSITGAPKVRAMQIIEELEPHPRGFYTGTIGWLDRRRRGCFSIAIRTAVCTAAGLTYLAGGGIVADSNPHREYEETMLKSEALRRALRDGSGAHLESSDEQVIAVP